MQPAKPPQPWSSSYCSRTPSRDTPEQASRPSTHHVDGGGHAGYEDPGPLLQAAAVCVFLFQLLWTPGLLPDCGSGFELLWTPGLLPDCGLGFELLWTPGLLPDCGLGLELLWTPGAFARRGGMLRKE